jgi:hypothetical protein
MVVFLVIVGCGQGLRSCIEVVFERSNILVLILVEILKD